MLKTIAFDAGAPAPLDGLRVVDVSRLVAGNMVSLQLADQGAEVIIPAGGDIIVFLAEDGIFEIDGTPILNGIYELIKMGETAVKLKKISGNRFKSKRSGYAPPTGDFLKRIRDYYGPDVYPGAE